MTHIGASTISAAPQTGDGLRLDDARIAVGGRDLISMSAVIAPGKILTVMGPSGSGKSSLLAYIAGTLASAFTASGAVELNGRSLNGLPPERRRIGILFQDDLLFPHLSVGGNLAFGLPADVRGRSARREACEAALASAGLDGFIDRDPATVSGGQRARIALLRVLLSKPEALLLDEPFSKLDASLRASFRDYVFAGARRHTLPTIMVTHDPADAAAAGGEVIVLDGERRA